MWPLLLVGGAGALIGGYLTDKVVAPSTTTTIVSDPTPTPYQLAVWSALGLGVYWLYRKASHA